MPQAVRREGIRELTAQMLQRARAEAKPFKLVSRVKIGDDGALLASVRPEQVSLNEPLGSIRGTFPRGSL